MIKWENKKKTFPTDLTWCCYSVVLIQLGSLIKWENKKQAMIVSECELGEKKMKIVCS